MRERPHIRCSRSAATGEPCRNWAMRGTEPPLCSIHAGRTAAGGEGTRTQRGRKHGFYSSDFDDEEIADLLNLATDASLDDEIACARVALRRALDGLSEQTSPEQWARLVALTFTGTRTVARLLRDRRAISPQAADGMLSAIGQILDEVSTMLDAKL